MPAVSKAQQRFMGMVYAVKKGEMSAPSSEVADAAASMKKKDAKDFASTKHKGLPEKKVAKEAKDFSQRDKIMKRAKPLHKHLYSRLHKKDTSGDVNEESNPRIPRKKGQPANSKKHSDLYTDENPKGTIHGLGFKDVATAKASVTKIRNSSRSHAHKIQAAVAMEQRAREMGKSSEAAVYRKFINMMKKKTKKMNEGWSDKYKKSIDCNNPKGFSQRAHCQGKKKKINETAYYKSDSKYQKKVSDAEKRHKEQDKRMKFGKFYSKAKEAKDRLRPGEVKRYDKKLGRYVSNKE